MSRIGRLGIAGASVALTLALPASAMAHGSAFETTALVNCTGPAAGPVTCAEQKQYVFTNHGFTYVLRESNGVTTNGGINYKRAPSLLRNVPGFNVLTSDAVTGAQPHATCDLAALKTGAAIRGWQGTDPFYAYVPFQKAAAGLEDDPSLWIEDVKTITGVDLATVADAAAACQGLGGTYVPADQTVTPFAALASGTIEEATAELETENTALRTQVDGLAGANGSATGELANVKAAYSSALAEIAKLQGAARALRLTMPSTAPTAAALAKDGLAVTLSGPSGRTFLVRMKISAAAAKKLGLRSKILGSTSVTLNDAGNASVTLTPTTAAAAGLRKARGPLELAAEATGADRWSLRSIVVAG